MAQILMLQSIVRPWRAGEAGRMFEAGRRYSDSPVLGVSLGPVDATVLSTLVSQGFAVNDTSTVTTAPRDDSVNEFVRRPAELVPLAPSIGALTVPCTLSPIPTVWSLRVTSADSADTVTVYETIDDVETSIGTLSVPAGDSVTDSYQKQFGATYRCAQAGSATLTAEVM